MSLAIPNDKPIGTQIEIAEEALSEAFARDLITMEELEKRLQLVQASQSNSEVCGYLQDLPQNILPAKPTEKSNGDLVNSNTEQKRSIQTTILSSNILRGKKLKKNKLEVKTILGDQTLDYSKTMLEQGKYFIHLTTILGETKIIVPPEYAVSSEINGILAEIKDKTVKEPDGDAPHIIITGKAVLGSVVIRERNSGFIAKIKQLFLE